MALDFPTSPTNNQLHPVSPSPGQTQYKWNSTIGAWLVNPVVNNYSIRIVSLTAPTTLPNGESLVNGTEWYKSDTGSSYIYYVDGDSGQWVQTSTGYVATVHPMIPQGRLTLTTGTPLLLDNTLTTSSILYYTPYNGNQVFLYDTTTTKWVRHTLSEINLTITGTTNNLPYDVFLYSNSGVLTLERVAWTDYKTRATNLVRQNGLLVKTGELNKLYLGCFFAASNVITVDFSATSTDNMVKIIGLTNAYHRVKGAGRNQASNGVPVGTGITGLNDGTLRAIYDRQLGNNIWLSCSAWGAGDIVNSFSTQLRESTTTGTDILTAIPSVSSFRTDHFASTSSSSSRIRHGLLDFRQIANTGAGSMSSVAGHMTYTVEY